MITSESVLNGLIIMAGITGITICIILTFRSIDSFIDTILVDIAGRKADKRETEQKQKEHAEDNKAIIIFHSKEKKFECSKCRGWFGPFYDNNFTGGPNYPLYCPKCGRKFDGIDRGPE